VGQIQGGIRLNEGIKVHHFAVFVQERSLTDWAVICARRLPDHLPFLIDVIGDAVRISAKKRELLHASRLRPNKSIRGKSRIFIPARVRKTDNLAVVVEGCGSVPSLATDIAQVDGLAIFPE